MEVRAIAKFIRMSPRKVRLVTGLISRLPIAAARTQLQFVTKAARLPVLKVLNSAVANAVNNFKLEEKDLRVKSATVDGGPVLKRWRARAMGRAAPIRKRTSHITIILTDEKVSGGKFQATVKKQEAVEPVETKSSKLKANS